MDIYGTCSTAVRDIYAISIFVSKVIDGVQNRQGILDGLQAEFNHKFLFLESLHILFFSDENGTGTWFDALPVMFQTDIKNILLNLKRGIGPYGDVASKHGLDLSGMIDPPKSTASDGKAPRKQPASNTAKKKSKSKELTNQIKTRIHQRIDKLDVKQKVLNLALPMLDQDQIEKLLAHCQKWVEKLRQGMMLILVTQRPIGSYVGSDLSAADSHPTLAERLGLENPIQRQMRALSEPTADFKPLEGDMVPVGGAGTNTDSSRAGYIIGKFQDDFLGRLIPALEERHDLVIGRTSLSEKEKREWKMKAAVGLAWLLNSQDPLESGSISPNKGTNPMLVLHCLGYRAEHGLSLVFQLPQGARADSVPRSLHDWIVKDEKKMLDLLNSNAKTKEEYVRSAVNTNTGTGGDGGTTRGRQAARKAIYEIPKKRCQILESLEEFEDERLTDQPSLSGRYFLAWALASTLYHIHAWGWVHKGICSRSILMFKDPRAPVKHQENIPYMLGWSASRPQTTAFCAVSHKEPVLPKSDIVIDIDGSSVIKAEERRMGVAERSSADKSEKVALVAGYEAARASEHVEDIINLEAEKVEGYDLEKDLYMHRDRRPGNSAEFQNKHDIHSLGVVLLEIGLWSTLSIEMRTAIATARKSHSPPDATRMHQLDGLIKSIAREARLERQMGGEYAQIVSMCLEGRFECLQQGKYKGRDADAALTREFYVKVVEPLRKRAMW